MLVKAAISARDLILAYGATIAVARSSFEIPSACLTAIIGPNGAGKSTVLGGIAGLVVPAAGTIRIHDDARVAYVLHQRRERHSLCLRFRRNR